MNLENVKIYTLGAARVLYLYIIYFKVEKVEERAGCVKNKKNYSRIEKNFLENLIPATIISGFSWYKYIEQIDTFWE